MRLVRKTRLAALVVMTTAALVLAAPVASAATISRVDDLGVTAIGLEARKAVLGIGMTGSGTFTGVSVVLEDVGSDGDFDLALLSDLDGTEGIAVYRDGGSVDDEPDPGDTKVSTTFTNSNGNVDVNVSSSIPASAEGLYTYFLVVQTSNTISHGDDFTVAISGGLCPFETNPVTLLCSGGATGTITADTTVPTAQLTTTPTTVDGNVVWTFNEDVIGVSEDNVVLRVDGSSTNIATTVTYDSGTDTATINPDAALSPGTTYRTLVNPSSAAEKVTDAAGNAVLANTQGTFSLMGVGFTPGVVRGNTWLLSNGPNRVIDTTFKFGKATDFPVAGDWDGDNQWQAGVVRGNVWYLANEAIPQTVTSFAFGKATDYPVVGDWDGNGTYTPGLVRGNKWFVSHQIPPTTLTSFTFASATDFPVVGDWDGNNTTTPGVVRGNVWYVTNQILPVTVTSFAFGKATDYPIAGDWNDDTKWTAGLLRGDMWFLANEPLPQTVTSFTFGEPTDFPVVGDWDGPITGGSAGAGLVPKIVPGS